MRAFMGEDFLLSTPTAEKLYRTYARDLPIIDYHCHINPREIAENCGFKNLTEAWLGGDHYKWRAVRACGFPERRVTGDADDYERFAAWAASMPAMIGNPLYAWTHLELKRYFGITTPLSEKTCAEIWEKTCAMLQNGDMRVRDVIEKSHVETICTTDDPADDLRWHKMIREDKSFAPRVLPAFRPDKGVNIELPGFAGYIRDTLSPAAGIPIHTLDDLFAAYRARIDFFVENGCRTSDHGLLQIPYAPAAHEEVDAIFRRALAGEALTEAECDKYKTALLCFFAREFAPRGIVMQLHYGAVRNNRTTAFSLLGPDTGFDTMTGTSSIRSALLLLDAFDREGVLPKMILYSLNPTENAAIDAMCGCFQGNDDGIRSKIQHGAAWWFNDHLDGIRDQMKSYAAIGVLGNFLGMLTDSRSFFSYTRHEYFRRILCDDIGGIIERGEYPNDLEAAGKIVADVSYYNTRRFFGLE